jgi:pimeloyl-ACP methyl ester carboxylesterase
MASAAVNGIDLYYEEHGAGPAVVFAHGAGGNHLSWWQQVPVFSRKYRCVTFDHRGWGLSLDGHDAGPAAFVEDLRELLDHLGIERAALVAQSMGGLTCLGFTIAYPQRVWALVMGNTFAGMRREVWLAADEELRSQAQAVWERRRSTGVRRALAPGFARREKEKAFLYRQIRLLNEEGPNRLHTEEQVMRARALERDTQVAASREALAAIRVPVLFIGGEHDEVMPPPLMEVACGLIPGAQMVVAPEAGHSVYFEQPDTFNRIALELLGHAR